MVLTDLPGGGPRRDELELRRFVDERASQIVRRRTARRVALPVAGIALLGIAVVGAVQLWRDGGRGRVSVTSDEPGGGAVEIANSSDRGLSARVTMSPRHPMAGELVRFTLTVDNPDDVREPAPQFPGSIVPNFQFGDGRPVAPGTGMSCPGGPDTGPRFHTRSTYTYTYAYQEPGTYRVSVEAPGASGCHSDDRGALAGSVSVGGSPSTVSNGPVRPYTLVTTGWTGERGGLQLFITAGDKDGVIRHVRIQWGDGSRDDALEFREQPSCAGHSWHDTEGQQSAQHHVQGPVTVEVTVQSVGCDGKDPQTATVRVSVSDLGNSAMVPSSPLPSSATVEPG